MKNKNIVNHTKNNLKSENIKSEANQPAKDIFGFWGSFVVVSTTEKFFSKLEKSIFELMSLMLFQKLFCTLMQSYFQSKMIV